MKDARLTFKDHHREERIFTARLLWSSAFVVILASVLLGRMVWLQWLQHERYSSLSDENRIQTLSVPPPRGLILDRQGRVLADNQPDFTLTVVPEQVKNMDATLKRLKRLVALDDDDIQQFRQRLKGPRRPWEPVPLRSRLTEKEIARLSVRQHDMPGVRVEAEAIRHYPDPELLAHVVGYVNRISEQDLRSMDSDQQNNYSGTHFYGRTGLERFYESRLHGTVGYKKVETNARGRILKVLDTDPPKPGKDLHLGLDLDVQRAAYNALGHNRGAVVAIDPRDGSVLAFVSRPSFNPNLFVTGISGKDYTHYRDDPDHPLFNRADKGQYPPGSTIKPFMGLAGLYYGATNWTRTIDDPGYYKIQGDPHTYRDWKKGGHGIVNLHKAIVQSCDTYFYDLGVRLGIDHMHEFLSHFSFGQRTGIDLPGERPGILPSRAWKRGARGASWYHGDTVNAAIGQGFVLVTPLQLATATAILARKGKPFEPHLAADRDPSSPIKPVELHDPKNWARMSDAMQDVVHTWAGTATSAGLNAKYRIAGKTGTAQVFSVPQNEKYDARELAKRLLDHALFIAYAPASNPAIAVAVLVENGSHGGSTAAPVARATMDAWLLNKDGQLDVPPPLHEGN